MSDKVTVALQACRESRHPSGGRDESSRCGAVMFTTTQKQQMKMEAGSKKQ